MSGPFAWALLLGCGLVLVPVSTVAFQVACATFLRRKPSTSQGSRPSVAVLIPAHDEASGIRRTLGSVKTQLAADDRLLVVADNCSDDTADIAAECGAEVVERHEDKVRGKGYALDFGVRHLEKKPPAMVLVVDADCQLGAGAIDAIVRACATAGRPVQAHYQMSTPGSRAGGIAEFAWIVKNLVRPLGFHRIGLPCQLMGTGMAFPWALIRQLRLASGNIVEDMKMGADCARAGFPPLFCPEAQVLSHFPTSEVGERNQRTRWEHGHLAMILEEAPRLLVAGLAKRSAGTLALAIDMCVPPLALLVGVILLLIGISAPYAAVTGRTGPLVFASAILLMLLAATGLSWWRFGRGVVSFRQLLLAPAYMARKLPMYVRFLVHRQVEWVRSKRDDQ